MAGQARRARRNQAMKAKKWQAQSEKEKGGRMSKAKGGFVLSVSLKGQEGQKWQNRQEGQEEIKR